MLMATGTSVTTGISNRISDPYKVLQYADDTLLFSTVSGKAIQTLKLTLQLFSQASGLTINYAKSALVPFNLSPEQQTQVQAILECPIHSLPLTYLGLPLTIGTPDRASYMPVIDKVAKRLTGWKGALLSRAGRIQLAKSVLHAIPIHFMTSFKLPRWVVSRLEQLTRTFIWAESKLPLLNWPSVCIPIKLGGLGLRNLALHNDVLLLSWWWRLHSEERSIWTMTARLLFSKANFHSVPMLWNSNGTFFWKHLKKLRFLFQLSTRWQIHNGESISFWYDAWAGVPQCLFGYNDTPSMRPFLNLRKASLQLNNIFPQPRDKNTTILCTHLHSVQWDDAPDQIQCRWSHTGTFSSSMVYKALVSAGKVQWNLNYIWRIPTAPKIRLFMFFLLKNRLLTQEGLQRRNFTCQPYCAMCRIALLETAEHLFFQCPFAAQCLAITRFTVPAGTVQQVVSTLIPKSQVLSFRSVLLSVLLWGIWIQRNDRIFRNSSRKTPRALTEMAVQEALLQYKILAKAWHISTHARDDG